MPRRQNDQSRCGAREARTRQLLAEIFGVADDHGQQIVEIVGDAAR
jgi:hypothetical protein